MNERIRELIKTKSTILFPGTDTVDCEITDIEKFAELIVQECTQVCLSQRDPANLNYKPSERFAEAVKKHFGVE